MSQETRTKTMGRHNFKKLKIWQEAMDLVKETYKIIGEFPDIERFNLSSQLIRCACFYSFKYSRGNQ